MPRNYQRPPRLESEISSKSGMGYAITSHLLAVTRRNGKRMLTCIEFHRCYKVMSLCATGLCLGHCELDLVIIELEYRVR